MVVTGLQPSKGAARRLLQQGGGYLNNQRVPADAVVTDEDLASESMLVLRAGKKKYLVVKVA
jgi:tyrosyl-tRNA synthetase